MLLDVRVALVLDALAARLDNRECQAAAVLLIKQRVSAFVVCNEEMVAVTSLWLAGFTMASAVSFVKSPCQTWTLIPL